MSELRIRLDQVKIINLGHYHCNLDSNSPLWASSIARYFTEQLLLQVRESYCLVTLSLGYLL